MSKLSNNQCLLVSQRLNIHLEPWTYLVSIELQIVAGLRSNKDPYSVLGVKPGASEADIKQAHRQLVKKHHPDVKQGDALAHAKFLSIQEVRYSLLCRSFDTGNLFHNRDLQLVSAAHTEQPEVIIDTSLTSYGFVYTMLNLYQ